MMRNCAIRKGSLLVLAIQKYHLCTSPFLTKVLNTNVLNPKGGERERESTNERKLESASVQAIVGQDIARTPTHKNPPLLRIDGFRGGAPYPFSWLLEMWWEIQCQRPGALLRRAFYTTWGCSLSLSLTCSRQVWIEFVGMAP